MTDPITPAVRRVIGDQPDAWPLPGGLHKMRHRHPVAVPLPSRARRRPLWRRVKETVAA